MRYPAARLVTSRLSLRPWSPDDVSVLARVLEESRAALARWTPWVLDESESAEALRGQLARFASHFTSGVEWRYAIFLQSQPARLLGGCGLFPRVGPGALEIGYWLATSATGNGFATEAAAALDDEAFRLDGVERLEIRCDPGNVASIRVPQRLGYQARSRIVHEVPGEGRPGGDVVVWERHREASRTTPEDAEAPR